ncbi:hypothetical protein [Halomonas rhizosphaerae]|uniref:Phage protein n=1 Tax=Halomonas rhizosphaerae TaxID=3043296 RepID=A0ABT6UYI7_9GAMM|nr:hypothetical protein [Halomonas rhizosphaerae]MDI5890645.1 hypothetical protein [Halomonas rhizosphaerae]
MKNKIEDLRNHLFAELERLGDESLQGEELQAEISRARAISDVAGTVIGSAKVEVEYLKATKQTKGTDFLPHDGTKRLGGEE